MGQIWLQASGPFTAKAGPSIVNPTLGTCVSAAGSAAGNLALPALTVGTGQSLVVFHKGTSVTDPAVTDSLSNTFVQNPSGANLNSPTSGCLHLDYVATPTTGSDTISVANPGVAGTYVDAVACTINNLVSFDRSSGIGYTAGTTAQTGTLPPATNGELVLGILHGENGTSGAAPNWGSPWSNYTGAGTSADVVAATARATNLVTGLAQEVGVTGVTVGFQRTGGTGNAANAAIDHFCGGIVAISGVPPAPPAGGVPNDEFTGPFASWTNVKTAYGAVGDGSHDDTTNIQNAISAFPNGGVIYFPTGTYKITGTLTVPLGEGERMVGHNPADTTISWAGSSGGTMFSFGNGSGTVEGMQTIERLTLNGNSSAHYIIYMNGGNSADRGIMDSVLENTDSTGFGIYMAGVDDTTDMILRDTFTNTVTGFEAVQANAIQHGIYWSTFNNNGTAILEPSTNGSFNAYNNYFNHSTTADIQLNGAVINGIRGNVSIGSKQFIANPQGVNSQTTIQGNRVVNSTTNAAISVSNSAMDVLVDNQITNTSATGPYVSVNPSGSNNGLLSIGNTYNITPASAESVGSGGTQNYLQVSDSQSGTIDTTAPSMPPVPPNVSRTIIDVAAPTGTASTDTTNVQNAITSACTAPNLGTRTVVHVRGGSYNINTTLTIPSGCDVQVIGDGMCDINGAGSTGHSAFTWTGTNGGTLWQLNSPALAVMNNLCLAANSNTFDGIHVQSADLSNSRVQIYDSTFYNGSGPLVGLSNIQNTNVNIYQDNWFAGTQNGTAIFSATGTGTAGNGRLAIWGDSGGAQNGSSGIQWRGLHVTSQGNIVEHDAWWENGPGYVVYENTGDAGNVADQGHRWGVGQNTSPNGNCASNAPQVVATALLNSFAGVTLIGPVLDSCLGPNEVTVTNAGSTTLLDNMHAYAGNYAHWSAPSQSTIASYDPWSDPNGNGSRSIASNIGTTTSTLVTSAWALTRSVGLPTPDTTLPNGVDNAVLSRLMIRGNAGVGTAVLVYH